MPLAAGVKTHPVVGLHVSTVHPLLSLQLGAVPAVHVPLWQISAPLHTVASAQDVPFATGVWRQLKSGSQPSVVHGLPSSHVGAVPAVHTPA